MLVDKFLYGHVENPHKLKELKVKIPLHYHMRLHGLKILGEDSISATVEKALELYFNKLGTPVDAAAVANALANATAAASGATGVVAPSVSAGAAAPAASASGSVTGADVPATGRIAFDI